MVTLKKTVHTPAKLNIRLKITGRRPDGYHELVSIMVPVSLFDLLALKITRSQRITIISEGHSVPNNEKNLAYRAAQSFFSQTGINSGLSIKLIKNIPVAAGLGGGSSNAAYTLKTLNEMWSNPLTPRDLEDLALNLGADVPFFLQSRPCLATGIGEILEPIRNWPRFWYVIITPPVFISTSWAYGNLKFQLTNDENNSIINVLRKQPLDVVKILENDLETVTASHFPIIDTIKKSLVDAGANGALMSGSGPSVFGIFSSKDQALSAKRALSPKNLGEVFMESGLDI